MILLRNLSNLLKIKPSIAFIRCIKKQNRWNVKYNLSYASNVTNIHLVDTNAIKTVVNAVTKDISDGEIIFEASPGPGLLTQALLDAGVKSLRCFSDPRNPDIFKLEEIKKKYPERLKLYYINLLQIDKSINDHLEQKKDWSGLGYLADIPVRKWKDPPPIKLIAPLAPTVEISFMRTLLNFASHKETFFAFGRPLIFVCLSLREYGQMKPDVTHRGHIHRYASIFYQNLFDVELIDVFKWECFLPKVSLKTKRRIDISNGTYFVRMTPKADFEDKIPSHEWSDYYFFLRQVMFNKKSYIIPYIESWVPDCGPKLIKFGIPLFKQFENMKHNELIDLFVELNSWPEFHESNFKAATNDYNKFKDEDDFLVKGQESLISNDQFSDIFESVELLNDVDDIDDIDDTDDIDNIDHRNPVFRKA